MISKRARILAPVLGFALLAGAVFGFGVTARAGGGLRADVFLVQKSVPKGLTERGLIGFARGSNARILREDASAPELDKRVWLAQMIVAFSQPPGDLQYSVLFYDIQGGGRRYVKTMDSFISNRAQRTFVQKIKLDRPDFKPNRKMELVVTVKRSEVGSRKFDIAGEEPRRTGIVNITDEQANQHD